MSREESVKLYNTYARKLYNISFRILHDSGEAEEVMQDTILKFLTSNLKPLTEIQTRAWLTKTCIRKSIDALRKNKREQLFLEEYGMEEAPEYFAPVNQEEAGGHTDLEGRAGVERIRNAISELPDSSQLVLNLVLLEGLDYEEVAEYTGAREATVRVQYSRARARLAEILKPPEILKSM